MSKRLNRVREQITKRISGGEKMLRQKRGETTANGDSDTGTASTAGTLSAQGGKTQWTSAS